MPNGRGDVRCVSCGREWCVLFAHGERAGTPSVAHDDIAHDGRGFVIGRVVADYEIECFDCRKPSWSERCVWFLRGWQRPWTYGRDPVPNESRLW